MKTIKTKLLLSLSALLLALVAIGSVGWYSAKVANDGLNTVYTDRVVPLRDLKVVADMFAVNIVDAAHKVRNGNLDWAAGRKAVDEARVNIKKYWALYSATKMDATERQLANDLERLIGGADQVAQQVAGIFESKDQKALDQFVTNKLYSAIDPVSEAIGKLTDFQIKVAGDEYQSSVRIFDNAHLGLIASLAVGAVIVMFSLWMVIFQITRPLTLLTGAMKELASGNFDVVLPGLGRQDEVGDVAQAVETFKVKSAEKARAEAQANADRELREAAEKAEREKIAAEAKAAADKRAEEERAAATAKVMAEFDAAVGGIANAASAGDFTQRVALEGKEGVILSLAQAMNHMCDNIGKVMDDLVGMMGSLAEGDLTKRIDANYQGAFGTLKESANATASKLAETVAEITASAKEVANAAAEISTSTTDLSQRTEEQAAGLEQTSASMEQISSTVKKNAESAQHADQLTASAREVADRGGAVVASTVQAMSRIEDSSNKIADIIGVIDEIARQTNLLALNAAVEAARAGDAGRGFAVVASEVRSLAQRSSQAAKDIKDLITSSSMQVKEGVDLVSKTGTSLNEIVESIKRVADIVADIATASNEQATGIDQVNKALTQMDEVTQQNSALVEENAATAKTLESQSAAMSDRVAFFRIERSVTQAIRSPAPKPPAAVKRGGPVGRMQGNLAVALKQDEFEEF
jgi:methyl-accepting chemotaxis protein